MLVGESAIMQALRHRVSRVARTTFTVLIEGESGAGKELVAQEIHAQSGRHRGPFVAVNCAALVETLLEAELFGIEERTATGVRGRRGKFELADRGTLFLDEVGDLSLTAQAKLLRVVQDMAVERVGSHTTQLVDTRIVAATNRRLGEMVADGRFRPDLFYRLSGVEIEVPPLRSRTDDIPQLVAHLLKTCHAGRDIRISAAAMESLLSYEWPGNVRQLGRVLERAVTLAQSSDIALEDLPDDIARCRTGHKQEEKQEIDGTLRAWSSRYVRTVLLRCRGNKRAACDVLDISYHTLQAYLEYGQAESSELPPARALVAHDSVA
jgi:transcriptional regulator with PAS, ATPase and Fis domain